MAFERTALVSFNPLYYFFESLHLYNIHKSWNNEPKLHAFSPCKSKSDHLPYTSGRDRVGSFAGEHLFLSWPRSICSYKSQPSIPPPPRIPRIELLKYLYFNQRGIKEYMITALKPFTNVCPKAHINYRIDYHI